jgi:hypothetical protein
MIFLMTSLVATIAAMKEMAVWTVFLDFQIQGVDLPL